MNKNWKLLPLLTAACLLMTACSSSSNTGQSKTIIITPAVKSNSTSLSVGDTLEVQIPTIPKTGFEWQVQYLDPTILQQEGNAVYTKDSTPNSAGGIVTLRFTAIGTGSTIVQMFYVSSASASIPALSSNSYSVTVEVK